MVQKLVPTTEIYCYYCGVRKTSGNSLSQRSFLPAPAASSSVPRSGHGAPPLSFAGPPPDAAPSVSVSAPPGYEPPPFFSTLPVCARDLKQKRERERDVTVIARDMRIYILKTDCL